MFWEVIEGILVYSAGLSVAYWAYIFDEKIIYYFSPLYLGKNPMQW